MQKKWLYIACVRIGVFLKSDFLALIYTVLYGNPSVWGQNREVKIFLTPLGQKVKVKTRPRGQIAL